MVNKRFYLLLIAPFVLTGCKKDEAFVDLSSIVFLIFIFATIGKYLSPALFGLPVFKKIRRLVANTARALLVVFLITGLVLNGYWIVSEEVLDRILGLIGLSLVVVGFHLENVDSPDTVVRSRAIEIVGMGSVITSVLTVMWILGPDMLNP